MLPKTRLMVFTCAVILLVSSVGSGAGPVSDQATPEKETREDKSKAAAKAMEHSKPPEWEVERWLNSPPLRLSDLRGKVVLVRWWTAGCPYCSTTAPALCGLFDRYGSKELVIVGMYHHKSKEPFDPSVYEATTEKYKFKFPVAFDPEWTNFYRWTRDPEGNPVSTGWTSLTFVLDKQGVVRHVHPGGHYVQGDSDYAQLTSVLEQLLRENSLSTSEEVK